MPQKHHSTEIEELTGLIRDFPATHKPEEAENLLNEIASRTVLLEQNIPTFLPRNQDDFEKLFTSRGIKSFHQFLFKDILLNAGQFRKTSDPYYGRIHFGGQKRQENRSQFRGSSPKKIEEDIKIACAFLVKNPKNPAEQAMRFYQKFVLVHPFYDANGRIARIYSSIYLQTFQKYVQWKKFHDKRKFISKLNKCHKRDGTDLFEKYFNYLLNYFSNYVIPLSDVDSIQKQQ